MMRKLAILLGAGAAFFALAALAFASVQPTVSYTSPLKQKSKPKKGKPANLTYTGILDIKNSDGTQPATAPTTKLYFAKQILNNAKRFPSCKVSDIDGKSSIPSKCRKAFVGGGTAASQIGSTPGTKAAITQNLNVKAYNGNKGRQILLVLNSSFPVSVQNRVIPGTIGRGANGFGSSVTFRVPPELQSNQGLQIALTHFNVVFPASKTVKVKRHGRTQKVSYLQLSSCPKSKKLPVKALVTFNQDNGQRGGPSVPFSTTTRCK
jgi:hypothetical protein